MFARFEAALLAGLTWPVADSVPTFNVEPFCRAVASRAAPAGDKDICLVEEREARDQLVVATHSAVYVESGADLAAIEILTRFASRALQAMTALKTARAVAEGQIPSTISGRGV